MGIEYFHHRMVLLLVPMELRLKELFKNSLYSKGTEEFSFSTNRLASTCRTESSLLAEVSHDEAKMRERRETASSNNASEAGRGLSPLSHFCLVVRDLC